MIPSPAPPRQAIRWGSRLSAAAVAIVGLLLGLPVRPALAAADAQITVTISQRWQLAGTQGTWTPYEVTVRDSGQSAFSGDLYLVPNDTRSHHSERLDAGEVLIAQFTDLTAAIKVRGRAEILTDVGTVASGPDR